MCGVYGIVSSSKDVDTQRVRQATDRIIHRGPDDVGCWVHTDRSVGLGHRRLSLVGVRDGQQPIQSEDRSVTAVVNGEFYGHANQRRELQSIGHRFRGSSDSEIVVHLYEQHGLAFVEHLRGEYAIVLWDDVRRRMVAVRDRFGIKPLVYTSREDRTVFASEAKAILLDHESVSWDEEAMFFATAMQYVPVDRTLFEGVRQVPPGHFAVVNVGESATIHSYWDLDYPTLSTCPSQPESHLREEEVIEEEVIQKTRKLLIDAVGVRLESETDVCFHLSGGLDSSAVLGIASHMSGKRQAAFTLSFESSATGGSPSHSDRYDEYSVAERTADFCGANLHQVRVTGRELLEGFAQSVIDVEGLAINGHLPAKRLLNQKIREAGYKVAFTGEGADEVFAGYEHLRMDWLGSQGWGASAKERDADRSSIGMMLPLGDGMSLRAFRDRMGFVPTFLKAKATLGLRVRSLMLDEVQETWRRRDAYDELAQWCLASGNVANRSHIHQSTWIWSKLALSGYIFKTLGDGAEMASSVEGRVPYLDHPLFEYCRTIPSNLMNQRRIEKHLLRRAAAPYVTAEVREREKHPLDAPPLVNLSELENHILDQIESHEFRRQPFFSGKKLRTLLKRLPSMTTIERQAWDPALMMVLSTLAIESTLNNAVTKVEAK